MPVKMPVTNKLVRSLLAVFLVCGGLYFAKDFLVPLAFAFMLAMLLIPLCRWFEHRGMSKALSALACVLLLVIFAGTVIVLLSWQVAGLAEDADKIKAKINRFPAMIQHYIDHTLGFPVEKQ